MVLGPSDPKELSFSSSEVVSFLEPEIRNLRVKSVGFSFHQKCGSCCIVEQKQFLTLVWIASKPAEIWEFFSFSTITRTGEAPGPFRRSF